jgi:hypothetical protein
MGQNLLAVKTSDVCFRPYGFEGMSWCLESYKNLESGNIKFKFCLFGILFNVQFYIFSNRILPLPDCR